MSIAARAPQSPQRIAYIDGLRGLAVLVILLFHLDVSFLKGGFIGVDIFFVISGFLITQIIARELNEDHFSFAGFYARRIRRIFPALFVMLFGASLAAILLLGPSDFGAFFKSLRYASAQFSNVFFSRQVDYFAVKNDHAPLLHTWSLGVEEQFYLVWPLLLSVAYRFMGRKRLVVLLGIIFVASLGLSEYWVHTNPLRAFYLLPSRAWELALGGIVALQIIPALRSSVWVELVSILGLLLIAAGVAFTDQAAFPGVVALLPCVGAAAIFYSAQNGTGFVHKALSTAAIRYVGLISYSLYLWHWPLIQFYKSYTNLPLDIVAQLTIGLLSFALAILSYFLIEQPTQKLKYKPVYIIGAGLLVAVMFIIGSNVLKHSDTANWRVAYTLDQAETRPNNLFKTCASPGGVLLLDECIIGPNKNSYEVVLAGDSHASHYTPSVLKWAKSKGLTVRLMVRGGCQAWVRTTMLPKKDGMVDEDCLKIRDEFYRTMDTQKSVQYVFLSLKLPRDNPDNRAALAKVASYHKRTIFLGSAPVFENDPHDCMVKNHLLITKLLSRRNDTKDCQAFDKDFVSKALAPTLTGFVPLLKPLGIAYFDPLPYMPTAFDAAGHFLYMDVDHLNQYGGEFLGTALIDYMKKK